MAVTYRVHANDEYFAVLIDRFWQQRPLLLRPAVQYAMLAIASASAWLLVPWKGADTTTVRWLAVAWALLLGPGAYFLTKAILLSRFRARIPPHTDTVFSLSDEGILVEGQLSRAELKWLLYARAVRFQDGILLVRPEVVCWLPDSALVDSKSSEAISLISSHAALRHVA